VKRVYSSTGTHAKSLCNLLRSEGISARFGWDVLRDEEIASVWVEDSDLERALGFVIGYKHPRSDHKSAAT
jgi:hypothetical protein